MSNQSRRFAKARLADKRLQAVVTDPVIDENDPTAILDVWFTETAAVHEAFERKQPGRPGSTYLTTMAPRTRAEGTLWIKAERQRRARAAPLHYKRLPRSRQGMRKLLEPIVEEANRMLPNLREPFTVKEFMPQESRVYSRPRTPRNS